MARSVSAATRQAFQAQTTDQVFLVCVEVTHDSFAAPVRMVNNMEAITSNGDVYDPVPFRFTPTVEEDGTVRQSSITIANVGHELIAALRAIPSAPRLQAFVIRAADPDTIEVGPWWFDLRNVSFTATEVSGELFPTAPVLRLGSITKYKNNTFPGLYG